MSVHACTKGVSTIAIPKFGSGLDQVKKRKVVNLLRYIFAYPDAKTVVYILEENGFHAMSTESDAEYSADDENDDTVNISF